MDRGYLDFERLYRLHLAGAFFVTRAKSNLEAKRRYSHPWIAPPASSAIRRSPSGSSTPRRAIPSAARIRFKTPEGKTLVFLTNNFALPALTIAELYRCRWQVELFFKWIKQHLRIKAFFGTSENAVKSQVWIAVSIYVLVAIVRKRLGLSLALRNPTDPQPDLVRDNPALSTA